MKMLNDICLPVLKLALPLMLIQICQASLGVMNTMVAGRYHYIDLAGIGLGSNIWTPVFILFTGILYVLVPKISAMQQGTSQEIGVLIQQGKKYFIDKHRVVTDYINNYELIDDEKLYNKLSEKEYTRKN